MKRVQYHRFGGPEEMLLETFELPLPGKGEIQVRVKAASINPFDWKLRNGYMKFMVRGPFPRAMGADFAGVVVMVGAGVQNLRVGDEIMGTVPMPGGALAEQLITKAAMVIKKPAALSFEAAAALPIVGVTAWRALVNAAHLKAGQSVLINGAMGGVGQAAVYIAKAMGAMVTGRVGPRSLDEAKAIGMDSVLDYTKELPASLHGRFDIVFDTNGSLSIEEGNALIKPRGIVIDAIPTSGKFVRSMISSRRHVLMSSPNTEILQKVVELAGAGKLPLSIGRTAPLDEAVALIKDLESGKRAKGKAVIVMA